MKHKNKKANISTECISGETLSFFNLPSCKIPKICYNSGMTHHNKAFTLAEVLITLGIIGVVAAITMPILIGNYKKKVIETKLQKVYSVLSQAMKLSESEHGDSDNWDFTPLIDDASNPEIVNQIDNEYFSKYLKNCHSENSNALVYGSGINMTRNQYYACSGFKIISQPLGNNTGANNIYKVPTFLFIVYLNNIDKSDIDKTGTGKLLGKDKFLFTYQSNQLYAGGVSVGGTINAVGILHSHIHDEDLGTGQCKLPIGLDKGGVAVQGEACATVIQRNGWKIPDDYPIKF